MSKKEKEQSRSFFKNNCNLNDAVGFNRILKMNLLDRYHYINDLNTSIDPIKDKLLYCTKAYYIELPYERWLRAYRPIKGYSNRVEEVRLNPYDDDDGLWIKVGKKGSFTVLGAKEGPGLDSDYDDDIVQIGSDSDSDSDVVEIGNITSDEDNPKPPPKPTGKKNYRKSKQSSRRTSRSSSLSKNTKKTGSSQRTTKKKTSSKKILRKKSKKIQKRKSKRISKKKSIQKKKSKRISKKSLQKRKSKRTSKFSKLKRNH